MKISLLCLAMVFVASSAMAGWETIDLQTETPFLSGMMLQKRTYEDGSQWRVQFEFLNGWHLEYFKETTGPNAGKVTNWNSQNSRPLTSSTALDIVRTEIYEDDTGNPLISFEESPDVIIDQSYGSAYYDAERNQWIYPPIILNSANCSYTVSDLSPTVGKIYRIRITLADGSVFDSKTSPWWSYNALIQVCDLPPGICYMRFRDPANPVDRIGLLVNLPQKPANTFFTWNGLHELPLIKSSHIKFTQDASGGVWVNWPMPDVTWSDRSTGLRVYIYVYENLPYVRLWYVRQPLLLDRIYIPKEIVQMTLTDPSFNGPGFGVLIVPRTYDNNVRTYSDWAWMKVKKKKVK